MDVTVSVIIPLYNREDLIERAVASVLGQSYRDFELIIVDDCSTDESFRRVSDLKDKKVRIFQLPKNSGAAAARNFGIEQSRGEYISLLDSDDFYEKDFLDRSISLLKGTGPEVGFSWTGVRYIDKNEHLKFIWKPKKKETPYLTLLHSMHIGTNSGIIIKKKVFEKCGLFDSNLPAAEDTAFFLKISQYFNYLIIPHVLINIEKNSTNRLSGNFLKIALAYNIFLPKHFSVINEDKKLRQKYYYKLMWLNYHLGNRKRARKFYKQIPDLNSGKLKALLVRNLYEVLPLSLAFKFHKKFSEY